MAKTRSFGGITQAVWECVKTTSYNQHGTNYAPPDANQGTATTSTPIGDVVLTFDYDPTKETVTYTIVKKPFLVSDNQIWSGIQDTADGCQG
ncbi:MAG: hypothetical protein WCD76_14175 [Pyrinomonadaceae bacterium]